MPISYLNPASLETPNSFKASGPLGGFLAGMNQDIANQLIAQSRQDNSLDNQIKQQKLDEDRALSPDKIAIQDAIASKALQDKAYYDSGAYSSMRESNDAARKSDNETTSERNKLQLQEDAAKQWASVGAEWKVLAPDGKLDPMNPQHRAFWEDVRQRLGKYSPNLPVFPDWGDTQKVMLASQNAEKFLAMKFASANLKNEQDMEKTRYIQGEATKRSKYAADEATSRAIESATQAANSRRDVANTNAAAKQTNVKSEQRDQAIVDKAIRTKDYDDLALGAAENLAASKANADLKASKGLQLQDITDPMARQKLVDEYAERILPGYNLAKKMKSVEAIQNPSKDTLNVISGGPARIGTKAEYDKLKSGDHYIDARDNKMKVKN